MHFSTCPQIGSLLDLSRVCSLSGAHEGFYLLEKDPHRPAT